MAKTSIIRRPDFAGGGITHEETLALAQHSRKWIGNAFRTDHADVEKLGPAIRRLYHAAGLKAPRVVLVPSPRIMAFAGGFSAAIWYLRKEGKIPATDAATRAATRAATCAATYAATRAATYAATDAATYAATDAATCAATDAATYAVTRAATDAATRAVTGAATRAATYAVTRAATGAVTDAATRAATDAATDAATRAVTDAVTRAVTDAVTDEEEAKLFLKISQELLGPNFKLGLSCAANWGSMYQGGNMWAAWDCYLTGYRDVLKLYLPCHEKYAAWEECAQLGGFRVLHDEFCIVSDFPEKLEIDEQSLPHCESGPSHRWRDGWSFWFIHGVQVTEQIVMAPQTLTPKQIEDETNQEVRRIMIQRFGAARYIRESGAKLVHELPDNYFVKGLRSAKLFCKPRAGDSDLIMVAVKNSTPEPDGSVKDYYLRVDPRAYAGEAARNCHAAIASTFRLPDDHKAFAYPDWRKYAPLFES